VNTSQFEAKPEEVDHWTPYSHWCADCWHWVVDCEHLVDPLPAEHHAVNDGRIQSLAYDRKTQRLEVRFRWMSVHQYRPVPFNLPRTIWKARPMNTALDEFVMKNRRIHFDEVRSDGITDVVTEGMETVAQAGGRPPLDGFNPFRTGPRAFCRFLQNVIRHARV
jgi:KTSC domain